MSVFSACGISQKQKKKKKIIFVLSSCRGNVVAAGLTTAFLVVIGFHVCLARTMRLRDESSCHVDRLFCPGQ